MTWALKSLKNFHFNGLFLSRVYIVWAKNYRGVIFHETEDGYKIWRGIDLSFQNWHKEFDKFWPEHSKVSKNFTLIVSFWAKYIFFELKTTEKLSFMTLKSDAKFGKKKMTCCLEIDGILLPKVENSRPQNLQRSYVSWQWRMIQKLKRNWLVVLKLTWKTS